MNINGIKLSEEIKKAFKEMKAVSFLEATSFAIANIDGIEISVSLTKDEDDHHDSIVSGIVGK
jgi:hypothetical protein